MNRFFVTKNKIEKDQIILDETEAVHALKVLRLKVGDEAIICDGEGTDYHAKIISLDNKPKHEHLIFKWHRKMQSAGEPSTKIVLCQGLTKSDKMDLIIQKCVELGVYRIIPVLTERVVPKVEGNDDKKKKVERWNRISMEAAKQSGRGIIPEVTAPIGFDDMLVMFSNSTLGIMPWEEEDSIKLSEKIAEIKPVQAVGEVWIFIGPEGGISRAEAERAKNAGMVSVSLGKRILRTETAGMAVISVLMYEFGEF